ncbi:NAD-P-binding protein [Trametes coccinea BRFM310]|uniref:NAD-P-binding protein n=1 Tax=Trametes coccinea (strain BRFM310) TaxID=1353009 RepID=A0A1Y2I8B4_TRAC3|nr:NAD-P-binding protein [Trametes coccinea BRFM310]
MSADQATPSRIAIVTGAAQGIGEAIALRLADDGLDVAVMDLPAKEAQVEAVVQAIRAKGRRSIAVLGDVSVEDDMKNAVEKTVDELGGLDVMVANAGIWRPGTVLDMTVEDYDLVMAVNARSVMLAIKYAGRQMVKQGRGGRIMAAASFAARQGVAQASSYCASKFAIRGLVQTAALELLEHNITVNAYAPGLIITPLSIHPDDEVNGGPASTIMKALKLPDIAKPGMPEDIAGLVSYIAKPEARYLTGQCIHINGGMGMA